MSQTLTPAITGGTGHWPVEKMDELLRLFRTMSTQAPEELTLCLEVSVCPSLPEVPEPLRGRAVASIAGALPGEQPDVPSSGLLIRLDDDTIAALVAGVGGASPVPTLQVRHLAGSGGLYTLDTPVVPEGVEVVGVFLGR